MLEYWSKRVMMINTLITQLRNAMDSNEGSSNQQLEGPA